MGRKKDIQISATIITYNEEKNIGKCLSSINWVDEIIVVDGGSSDKTVEVVKRYTDNIYFHKFTDFASQRNYALQYAKGKWIMVLDADEELQNKGGKIIRRIIKSDRFLGFWLPRRNYVNNKRYLKYGYFYPDYQLKLYRNIVGLRYEGTIHAQPIIDINGTERLNNPEIYHNHSHSKYDSFCSFKRFFPYIRIEGKEMAQTRKSSFKLFIEGLSEFIRFVYRSFIKTKGYKDGYPGFRAAVIYGMYICGIRLYALFTRLKKGKYF